MAIQLRHQTQQTEKPSALSHGVGLPVSDGGMGAIAQAVGQVAGAAGQFAKRRQALNNQAITDATNTYQNEVNTQVAAASAAAKAEDMEAYEAAMAEMDKLQGAPLNAFAAATDKPLNIKEEDWMSQQRAADAWYTTKRGALDTSTVNSQYTAKFSRSLKEVGSAAQLNISEGNLGTSGMMELIGRSEKLHGGDLSVGATAPAMETLEAELARYGLNHVHAFGSSKSKYTSVDAWNRDVGIQQDMVSKSSAFGRHNGKIMKALESLRVNQPKGVNVPLTGAAESLINNSVEKVKTSIHFDLNLSAKLVDTISQYDGKKLSPAVAKQLTSVKKLNALVTEFGSEDNRAGLAEYLKFNPDKTVEEFLNEVDPEGTMFDNMRPAERNAFTSHMQHVMDSMTSVPLETSLNSEQAGQRQLNKAAVLAAQSPENALSFEQGTNLQNQALNAYDLANPEAAMGFIREANEKFSPITEDDYENNEFFGLNNTLEYLEANSNNPRALVQSVGVTQAMLGEKRVANLVASHTDSVGTPELNLLVAGLRNNAIFAQDRDTKSQQYVAQGMDRKAWVSSVAGTATADRYSTWTTFRDDENSKVSKVIQDLGAVSQAQANYWSNYIEGYAIEKIKEDSSISAQEIDEFVTTQIKNRVQIHEAYGNSSVVMMANREDGSFSGGFMSGVKRATAFGLTVAGKVISLASPDPYFGSKISAEFGAVADLTEAKSLTGEMYVEGKVDRAIFHVIDTGVLEHNMQKFGNPELEGKLMKLAPAEDQLLKMRDNGDVKLSDTMVRNGVSVQTLQVKVPIKLLPEGLGETLITGGKTEDSQWMPLTVPRERADGTIVNEPYEILSVELDITAKQYADDLHRTRMKRITDSVKDVGAITNIIARQQVRMVAGSPAMGSKGKADFNARSEALKQFFSDLF
jgi:hypothetical protein